MLPQLGVNSLSGVGVAVLLLVDRRDRGRNKGDTDHAGEHGVDCDLLKEGLRAIWACREAPHLTGEADRGASNQS